MQNKEERVSLCTCWGEKKNQRAQPFETLKGIKFCGYFSCVSQAGLRLKIRQMCTLLPLSIKVILTSNLLPLPSLVTFGLRRKRTMVGPTLALEAHQWVQELKLALDMIAHEGEASQQTSFLALMGTRKGELGVLNIEFEKEKHFT
jgi:hypothetical protein